MQISASERQRSRNGKKKKKIRTYKNSIDENVVLMINNSTKGTKRKSLRVVITRYSRLKIGFASGRLHLGIFLKEQSDILEEKSESRSYPSAQSASTANKHLARVCIKT